MNSKIKIRISEEEENRIWRNNIAAAALCVVAAFILVPLIHGKPLIDMNKFTNSSKKKDEPITEQQELKPKLLCTFYLRSPAIKALFPKPRLSDVDTTRFSVALLEAVGVDFPIINGILIPFMETSFCKCKAKGNVPTLCSPCWEEFLTTEFNTYNPMGMKRPYVRRTTAVTSLGRYLKDNHSDANLPDWMYEDPHAVYSSYVQAAKDIKLWQEMVYKRKGRPTTAEDYIALLSESGWNEHPEKYEKTLRRLYSMYLSGDFQRKYERYYNNMNLTFYDTR